MFISVLLQRHVAQGPHTDLSEVEHLPDAVHLDHGVARLGVRARARGAPDQRLAAR
jgi:hypothetical protein